MKKYIVTIAILLSATIGRSQVLNVPEVIQEQDQWCWAGCSKCVLNYYGDSVDQCDIAEYARQVITWHSFGSTNCCTNPSVGCNYWNYNWSYDGSIQDILQHFDSVMNHGDYTLTLPEVGSEIAANHPFVAHWSWTSGGGHFVVGHGVSGTNVYYMNPWFGEGLHMSTYDWLVNDGSHTWDATNVITSYKTPASGVGVATVAKNAGALVYPNPSTGVVYVDVASRATVDVYNATGVLVYNQAIAAGASIDLSTLPKGIYMVRISAAEQTILNKLVLE